MYHQFMIPFISSIDVAKLDLKLSTQFLCDKCEFILFYLPQQADDLSLNISVKHNKVSRNNITYRSQLVHKLAIEYGSKIRSMTQAGAGFDFLLCFFIVRE